MMIDDGIHGKEISWILFPRVIVAMVKVFITNYNEIISKSLTKTTRAIANRNKQAQRHRCRFCTQKHAFCFFEEEKMEINRQLLWRGTFANTFTKLFVEFSKQCAVAPASQTGNAQKT